MLSAASWVIFPEVSQRVAYWLVTTDPLTVLYASCSPAETPAALMASATPNDWPVLGLVPRLSRR